MVEILVIEDSKTQSEQIVKVLQSVNATVYAAFDAPEGLRLAVEKQPSLIILDIVLPSMDGFQVCYRLRRDPLTKHIPVIMLTEKNNPQAIKAGVEAGADDYIPKDVFAVEHLMNSLRDLNILE